MRFAMISDIHGNIWALEAVLATIRAMGDIDMIVNPGDILSGPLEPSATADRLGEGREGSGQERTAGLGAVVINGAGIAGEFAFAIHQNTGILALI
ncbi:metallophosphoesterase family protein [Cupriavidus plantarum]|uniref:metallophosphoesterase family protein n=1 Tax=Cupriavidus plantarum TaxID=942865 RepID=UPI001B1C401C|nr:hypothetical protein LMG26296_04116 [Cupriavidus plantarum]